MRDGQRVIPVVSPLARAAQAQTLTERQTDIVDMIAAGYTDKQVAFQLGIAPSTLRTHLERLFRRFGVHSRAALVASWLRMP